METDENLMLDFGEGEEAIEDIDKFDTDPQLASEYTKEIYQYMRELEVRFQINPAYMSEQQGVNPAMRTILIDWLVEVHKRFKLVQESLYLAVHILDRFLAVHTVARAKLQLVGLGCLLVASKYEDTWPPRIGDLIFIADKAYTREEIIAMECLILDKLEYNLGCPMPLNFLRRYSKVADSDAETHTLAKYLLEISLLDYDMCAFTYSQQAAASLHLSRAVFGQQPWVCLSHLCPTPLPCSPRHRARRCRSTRATARLTSRTAWQP
jgi:cyclin B